MKETKMSAEKVVKEPKPKLMNIKLEKLHPFESHPYKVLDDESMTELVESIKKYGLLNRIIVRPIENNTEEYEIISGHRRVRAAELLEMKEVPVVVHFIDRDQATILMVDSNCQRENLTLMEKDGNATAVMKNTSATELGDGIDFTERFVRGDKSRTDGGSGLGLSIAKSFTEACGGSFRVETDADLFTAAVSFAVTDNKKEA